MVNRPTDTGFNRSGTAIEGNDNNAIASGANSSATARDRDNNTAMASSANCTAVAGWRSHGPLLGHVVGELPDRDASFTDGSGAPLLDAYAGGATEAPTWRRTPKTSAVPHHSLANPWVNLRI